MDQVRSRSNFAAKFVCVLLLASLLAFAQSDLTSITGFVRDASGAVVPNAQVTLKSEATGQERKAKTNESGYYIFTNIPSATYSVIVEAQGFKRTDRTGAKVDPSAPATVDVVLAIGQATDTVEVRADAVAIQAESATLGRVVQERQIRDLQLNGRNPIFLALLKPGVNGGALSQFSFGLSQGGLNINGSRVQDNLITFDGAVSVRTRSNGSSIGAADADATQEVQILTSNYNPEYGRSAGGQVRIITKSGTRDFHGTAYEYFRNSALDANTWARNRVIGNTAVSGAPAPFRFNQFGYNFSGPLFIPGKFNKDRNKLFFLFGQEILRYRIDVTESITVPTALMRQGNFSELLNSSSPYYSGKAIIDPTTGAPFPGNIIPANRLSKNGVALLNTFPTPTAGYQQGKNDFLASASGPQNQRKETGSVDWLPADNHYVRFRVQNYSFNQYVPFPNDNGGVVPQTWDRPNQTVSANYVWTINPTTINEFLATASVDRVRIGVDTAKGSYDRTKYGINYPYVFPNGKEIANKIPTITIANFQEINGLPYPSSSAGPIYDFSDTFTKIAGNHTLKAGVLFERAGENDFDQINITGVPGGTNNQNGRFVFTDSRPGGSGQAVADAALGLFSTYAEIGQRSYTPYRGHMYEFFLQDSWKVTPKLRVEYGFRESIIQPFSSLWGNMVVFDPKYYDPAQAVKVDPKTGNPIANSGNPLNGAIIPGYSSLPSAGAGRVPALANGQNSSLFKPNEPKQYSDIHVLQGFQPRVGLAYQIDSKTVVRSGVGRFMTRLGVSDSVLLGGNPPLQPTASISNGLVDSPLGVGGAGTYPISINSQDKTFYNPESWAWNVAVQREVGFQTTVEVAYVGRRGLHLQQERNINQLQPGTLQANPGVNENALRPYLGYGAIRVTNNDATSTYNGLQFDMNRRFSKGLLFGFAYTYSKSSDNGSDPKDSLANAYDRSTVWGPSNFDRRHVAVANVIYELPFFTNHSQLTGKLLGGWQVSMVAQFQTGNPFSVQTGDDFAGVGSGSGNGTGQQTRWIINGNVSQPAKFANQDAAGNAEPNYWYSFVSSTGPLAKTTTPNVTQPAAGTFTNQLSRNMFYNPGFQNWNMGIFKDFHFTEKQYITFRAEGFNFLNHPNWNGVDTNPNSKYFGQVTTKDSNNPNRNLQLSLRYSF
jgi:hypothetical protein